MCLIMWSLLRLFANKGQPASVIELLELTYWIPVIYNMMLNKSARKRLKYEREILFVLITFPEINGNVKRRINTHIRIRTHINVYHLWWTVM